MNIEKEKRIFSGFGTISVRDKQGDYIDVLREFRDKNLMEIFMRRGAPVIDSHSNHQVGKIISYEYKNAPSGLPGLYLTAEIFRDYPTDDTVWENVKNGAYTGFSLGGRATEKTPVCDENGCYNVLSGIENWEWSIVETPANQEALIDSVNKLAKSFKRYRVIPKTINTNNDKSLNVTKAKVYIKNPEEAPEDAKVSRGEKGGLYYEPPRTNEFFSQPNKKKEVENYLDDAKEQYNNLIDDIKRTPPEKLLQVQEDLKIIQNLIAQIKEKFTQIKEK